MSFVDYKKKRSLDHEAKFDPGPKEGRWDKMNHLRSNEGASGIRRRGYDKQTSTRSVLGLLDMTWVGLRLRLREREWVEIRRYLAERRMRGQLTPRIVIGQIGTE